MFVGDKAVRRRKRQKGKDTGLWRNAIAGKVKTSYLEYRVLVRPVIKKARDVDIWKVVLDLTVAIS
ncbi:hypothetical protein ACJ73_06280 [Blastomyces percursus]|uniref:Uncharacterized protein n=1 Tax=Blastomyces percursus TaxID=1658174 RepID=A0A1J9Q1H4_9EURO|nr:hypothetical protein ACJ73_06280 [Blastomyces percursus]